MTFDVITVIAGLAITLLGAAMATSAANAMKRLVGVVIGFAGVVAVLGRLGGSEAFVIAASAVAFAHIALGAAIVIRLKEAYGTLEIADLNAADSGSEPPERSA